MPKGLRIEHLCDIIPKAQSWLVLNLPVFMFVYIHFNVPPTRTTDLVRNVSDEKIIDMEPSPLSMLLLFPTWFVFSQAGRFKPFNSLFILYISTAKPFKSFSKGVY